MNNTSGNTRRLLKITEAAENYALSRSSIYVLLKSGQLTSVKIGKARRIPVEAMEALIAAKAA